MNKNLKTLNNKILKNQDLEESIPSFLNQMANQYYTYGAIRLSLHYYAFYETYCDNHKGWSKEALDMVEDLNKIIADNIITSRSHDENDLAVKNIDKLRNKLMKRMKSLIVYTDIFMIYEYIMNRVEYRFKDGGQAEDDDDFARDILRYIFDSQDNLLINEKIRDIIGQLPVRMTKQKYYDIIKDSFKHYVGADWNSLQSYLYMLRTNAMLYKEEGMEEEYPCLWEQKEKLSQINYRKLTQDQYDEIEQILGEATELLKKETEVYYSLQEIMNEAYTMLLCNPYLGIEVNDLKVQEDAALYIIKEISDLFSQEGDLGQPSDQLIEQFSLIEGVQEELSYDLTTMEEALYQLDVNLRELSQRLKADLQLNALLLSKDLLSNSLFIDFYEVRTNEKVDDQKLEQEANKLIDELVEFLTSHDRFIGRAVMANTLSSIPVFLQDHKEVMDYVRYSLEKCTDPAEKIACNKIIREMISE